MKASRLGKLNEQQHPSIRKLAWLSLAVAGRHCKAQRKPELPRVGTAFVLPALLPKMWPAEGPAAQPCLRQQDRGRIYPCSQRMEPSCAREGSSVAPPVPGRGLFPLLAHEVLVPWMSKRLGSVRRHLPVLCALGRWGLPALFLVFPCRRAGSTSPIQQCAGTQDRCWT